MTETLEVLGAAMIVRRDAGLFVAENPIPPGYFAPPHRHGDDEETLLVMEGELTLIGEDGERKAGPGTCVTCAPGDLHGFRNNPGAGVRWTLGAPISSKSWRNIDLGKMGPAQGRAPQRAPVPAFPTERLRRATEESPGAQVCTIIGCAPDRKASPSLLMVSPETPPSISSIT